MAGLYSVSHLASPSSQRIQLTSFRASGTGAGGGTWGVGSGTTVIAPRDAEADPQGDGWGIGPPVGVPTLTPGPPGDTWTIGDGSTVITHPKE